jgi:DNA repair exonuclease SbcCD nuclease subunit
MIKILTIGDPHVTMSNLEDSGNLLNLIYKAAKKNKVDIIEFTGDLCHNHAVLRQEILHFWRKKLEKLSELNIPIIIIAGNHDFPGRKEFEGEFSAISNFEGIPNVIVVNDKFIFNSSVGPLGYMAYTSYNDILIEDAQELYSKGVERVLIHQTCTGVQYSNGFYAEDGVDPALFPQKYVVSGHIHTSSQIGKCFYVGSPKADNMAEANQDKGIWLFEYDGNNQTKQFISTENAVTVYKKYTVNEGEEIPKLNPKHKNYIELVGSNSWINTTKKQMKNTQNLQIKAVPTDQRSQTATSNLVTLKSFLSGHFKPAHGILLEDIEKYLGEL